MTVRRGRSLGIVIGRARASTRRQTLWRASACVSILIDVVFSLDFVAVRKVANSWKLRSERKSGQ